MTSKLSPQDLNHDFEVFKSVLLSAHPNPYRFLNPSELNSLAANHKKLLADSLSDIAFFQIISSIMSAVGEGHSKVGLSDKIIEQMKSNGKLLPLELHFHNGRAFVSNDQSNFKSELEGFEVLSINGKAMDNIINQIDSISCLGTAVNRSLVYRKLSLLQNFAIAYFLFVDQSSAFNLELTDRAGVQRTVRLEGKQIDFDVSFTQELAERYPPFSLDVDTSGNLAIMKISTFAHWVVDLKFKDYKKFYQQAFKIIENEEIEYLVIDVRDNRGGHEYLGSQLLSYLIDKPFNLEASIFSKEVKFPVLDSLHIKYDGLRKKAYQKIDTGYFVKESIVLKEQKPSKKYQFDGQVFFLVNGNCFSACNIFMALADFHGVGTIIGEESGGIYQDTDGYFRLNFNLPNSGLKVTFPLWHIKTSVKRGQYGRGVFPDIHVEPTIDDILGRQDPMLEKVYELLDKESTNP